MSGGISFYFIRSLSSEQQKRSCQPRDVAFPLPHCQTRDDGRCWSPSFPPRFSSALGLTFTGECHSAAPTSSRRPKIVAIFLLKKGKIISFIRPTRFVFEKKKEFERIRQSRPARLIEKIAKKKYFSRKKDDDKFDRRPTSESLWNRT